MKIEDLPEMPDPDPKKGMFVTWVAARDDAMRARLAYAKELLQRGFEERSIISLTNEEADRLIIDCRSFIEKLNSEGL